MPAFHRRRECPLTCNPKLVDTEKREPITCTQFAERLATTPCVRLTWAFRPTISPSRVAKMNDAGWLLPGMVEAPLVEKAFHRMPLSLSVTNVMDGLPRHAGHGHGWRVGGK